MSSQEFIPTRLEAGFHLAGIGFMVAVVVSFVAAPFRSFLVVLFCAGAACLEVVYFSGMHRLTGWAWLKDFTFKSIGEAARLQRFIWSPSGVRRSIATLRGR